MNYMWIGDGALKPSFNLCSGRREALQVSTLFYFRYSWKAVVWEGKMAFCRLGGLGWFPLASKPSLKQLSSGTLILCDASRHLVW